MFRLLKVSAHSGQGIDELLDLILIQSELMELKASAEGAAQGVVIEARVDKGRGAVIRFCSKRYIKHW